MCQACTCQNARYYSEKRPIILFSNDRIVRHYFTNWFRQKVLLSFIRSDIHLDAVI